MRKVGKNLKPTICFENPDKKKDPRIGFLPYGKYYLLNSLLPKWFFIDIVFCRSVMICSAVFIAATIVVYIFLPQLRNLHGKCLLCYMVGLLIGYIAMACIQLELIQTESIFCKLFGYWAYAAFLSSFFWSSVIGFDLWSSFW